ncbi:hypothetical protein K469DRAFT_758319 [Zopfia rhizophila CBS 207.26]|uniref:HTH psq-type domain-containing protein n=1 Tax=Zopfia rhizophila CBS 207.26 TaxID=1314779 RepID=A0A6A6EWQ2_9PEZI|nr:hypothetical protein K469DRAFT_758319 [Zopfia rhizophila CBS 207.26]
MGELYKRASCTLYQDPNNTINHSTMHPPTDLELISREARIQLAIHALDIGQIHSLRNAARIYNVPSMSLKTRRDGTTL